MLVTRPDAEVDSVAAVDLDVGRDELVWCRARDVVPASEPEKGWTMPPRSSTAGTSLTC